MPKSKLQGRGGDFRGDRNDGVGVFRVLHGPSARLTWMVTGTTLQLRSQSSIMMGGYRCDLAKAARNSVWPGKVNPAA